MCERPEVQYGTVVQVHVLRADNCPFPDLSMKELATSRLKMREDPLSIPDITSYFKYRKSIMLVFGGDRGWAVSMRLPNWPQGKSLQT